MPKPAGAVGNLAVLNWAGFQSAVTWTFDDSQPSQIEHYAELQAVGVPMTFYICEGNKGLANFDATWTQAVYRTFFERWATYAERSIGQTNGASADLVYSSKQPG